MLLNGSTETLAVPAPLSKEDDDSSEGNFSTVLSFPFHLLPDIILELVAVLFADLT